MHGEAGNSESDMNPHARDLQNRQTEIGTWHEVAGQSMIICVREASRLLRTLPAITARLILGQG